MKTQSLQKLKKGEIMNTMVPIAFVECELAAGKNKIVIPKGVYRLEDCGRKFFPLKDLKNVEIDFPART